MYGTPESPEDDAMSGAPVTGSGTRSRQPIDIVGEAGPTVRRQHTWYLTLATFA